MKKLSINYKNYKFPSEHDITAHFMILNVAFAKRVLKCNVIWYLFREKKYIFIYKCNYCDKLFRPLFFQDYLKHNMILHA